VNDLTREALAELAGAAEEAVAVLVRERDHLRDQLRQVQAALDAQATHLRTLRTLRAMLAGEHAPLAPRDVVSDDDVLGVRIGPLMLAPASAGAADLRLYLGTVRAISDALIRQARLAGDALRAAETPTGEMPLVQPDDLPVAAPDPTPDQQTEGNASD
jgi:hypothetical protein